MDRAITSSTSGSKQQRKYFSTFLWRMWAFGHGAAPVDVRGG